MKIYKYFIFALIVNSCQPGILTYEADVLVIGGSTSGTAAGIQAARLGSKTLLVEETRWLGGMMTAGGVCAVDGNHDLPSGIWNEFRELLHEHYGSAEFLQTGWASATMFEPQVGDRIFKKMAENEDKLEIIYEYWPVSVQRDGDKITGATFSNSEGEEFRVKARITIDATDLGDALAMADVPYHLGMDSRIETGEAMALLESNDMVQDLAWVAILKDYGRGANKTIDKPEDYDANLYRGCCTMDGNRTDCNQMLNFGKLPNKKYMINWPRNGNDIYLNVVEMTREERIAELQKAKNKTLGFVYYIQTRLGYRNLGLADDEFSTDDQLPYLPYHREGRRLDGVVRFNYNQMLEPYQQRYPLYRTGISVGDYPLTLHHKCNPSVPNMVFPPVPSFCIPLGVLIPERVDGLIVSDKAISVTSIVSGLTCQQPVLLLTGQAAGVLAALSATKRRAPRDISVREVQQKLLDALACIMPLYDVNPNDPHFQEIQRIAATGILKTQGEPYHKANRTWFHPDSEITFAEFCDGLTSYRYLAEIESEEGELLTLGKCMDILSSLKGTKVDETIQNDWETFSLRPFEPDVPVTKREIAVLLDRVLNPFVRQIDHQGVLK